MYPGSAAPRQGSQQGSITWQTTITYTADKQLNRHPQKQRQPGAKSFLLERDCFYPSNRFLSYWKHFPSIRQFFFRLLRTGNQGCSFHAIAHKLLAVPNKAGSFSRSTRHDQNKTPKLTNSPTRIISINTNKRHKDNLFDTFRVAKYQNDTS